MRIRPFGRSSSPERSTGLWLDLAGGGALLDGSVRGQIEPGIGYNFASEYVGIGPFGRYTQIIETGDKFGGNDARFVMVGLEMTFLDGRPTPMMPTAAPIATDTRQLEQELAAAKQREEAMRIEQQRLEAEKQRLAAAPVPAEPEQVLDAQLFFDYNSAILRAEGKEKLRLIAGNYLEKRDQWQVIRIQGNADDRGPDAYNLRLSADRATAARLYLVSLGVPDEALRAEAYGEKWPRVPDADNDPQFQQNRNVAFVIVLGDEKAAAAKRGRQSV